MATHDYIISNASGAAVRADLNNALAAIATNNSSATAPTTTYAYQWWADTGSTPTVMKLRNAANSAWITLFQLDGEWSLIPFENGTAAAPSIYFKDSGTDTGFYSPGVDQVGITTGGAVRLTTSTTAFTGTLPWRGQNGTAAAPALSFSGDPNSGVYNVGADDVGISTNGTLRFDVSTTATTSTLPVVHPLGAVGTPSVTFTGDLNTGIYSPGADSVAITTGGTARATVDSSGRMLINSTTATNNLRENQKLAVVSTGASAYGGASFTSYSGSATADAASIVELQRSRGTTDGSMTVIASGDSLGRINWRGSDGTNFIDGAFIRADVDGTPGANDMPTRLVFATTADGAATPTERCRIDSSGRLLVGTSTARTNFFTGVVAPQIQLEGNSSSTSALSVVRNSNDADGPTLLLGRSRGTGNTVVQSGDRIGRLEFQGNDGTNFISAGVVECFVDGTPGANDMPGRIVLSTTADGAASPTERVRIMSNGDITFGNGLTNAATALSNTVGIGFEVNNGAGFFSRNGAASGFFNRKGSDGDVISIIQDGVQEGTIHVSGTTVTLVGAHLSRWSQILGIDPYDKTVRPEILRGTVMSNLDEMCDWIAPDSGDAQANEQLNKTKISDVEGDKNVAGVFQSWDDDDDTWVNDYYLAMTGDFVIRIAAGVTVERGDLLMSAGDGTAKPQTDDALRSCTIAKVTSTHISHTFDDGSYCVPCVLMAC